MTTVSLPTDAPQKPVSRRLVDPLRLVAGRARVLAFLRASFQLLVLASAGWLLIVLILGTARDLPIYLSVPLALAAWFMLVYGGFRFFIKPGVFKSRNLSTAARMVDVALPNTQERISSAVELSQETDARYRGSPELVACLIRQAEKDADKLDPNLVVSGRSVLRWFLLLLPILALWLILLVARTPDIMLGLHRTFQPWVAAPPPPTATLKVEPGNLTIAQGEEARINLTVTPVEGSPDEKSVPRASIVRRFTNGAADQDLTTEMDKTGTFTFRTVADNVEQSFTYKVASEGVQSPTYTVTVQPRPSISSLEISYAFPPYTRLPARTDKSRDGAIDALAGTKIKITVDSAQPLKSAQLVIADNAPNPGTLEMAPLSSSRYAAEFTLAKTTTYRILLVNQQNLDNKDHQPRNITARIDAPPLVEILSPVGSARVRPDDIVPIQYASSDDFGIAKLEALLQIDDMPPQILPILTAGANEAQAQPQTKLAGKWNLSVAEILRTIPRGADAKKITYQLRATDNRQPESQTGLSARQVLEIDKTVAPLAQQQDAEAVRDLMDAVKKAERELEGADKLLEEIKKSDPAKPLDDVQKQQLADARQRLAEARKDLEQAAEKAAGTRLSDAAKQAKQIAEDAIRRAEEKAADAQLAADQPEARKQHAADSQKNIADAQKQLAALAKQLGDKAKEQPLAQEVERLAAEQRQLADAMEQHPNDPALKEQQRKLQQKTEKLIKENPELQKPAADASKAKQDDLVKKIQQLEQAQQSQRESLKNQAEAAGTKDKLRDLATRQAELNQQLEQFKNQQADSLKQAGAKTPDKPQMDPIVKDLQNQKLEKAAQGQRAAGVQLDEAAARLEAAEKRQQDNAAPTPRSEAAAQAAKDAEALKQETKKLASDIEQARKDHVPPTRPSDPANRQASKLADDLKKEAQQMAQSPATKQAAQDAAKNADAAKREAAAGNAQAAQEQLAQGAAKLEQAAKSLQPAAAAPAIKPGAAAQARELSDKQRALADQTAQANKSLEDAAEAKSKSAESAKEQQQLADKMDDAAKDAEALKKESQGGAPDMSQRAAKAAQALRQAAQAQRSAAKSTDQSNASQASKSEEQSAEKLAQAEESLTGRRSSQPQQNQTADSQKQSPQNQSNQSQSSQKQAGQSSQSQSGQSAQGQSAQGQSAQGQSAQGQSAQGQSAQGQSAQGQSAQGQSAQGQSAQGQSAQGQSAQGQSAQGQSAQGQSAQGQSSQAQSGQSAQDQSGQSQTAQGQPGQGPSGQAQSSQSAQGQSGQAQSAQGQSGQGQSGQTSQGQSSQSAQGQSGQGQAGQGETVQGQSGQPGQGQNASQSAYRNGSPDQSAARAIQSARSAQSRAANGEPAAARQAADQLNQASQQLSGNNNNNQGSTPQQNASASGQNSASSPGPSGQASSANSTNSSAPPGPSSGSSSYTPTGSQKSQGSGHGITLTEGPHAAAPPPKAVQEIGLSPSDWARLPPTMQEQLLHSAQQSGPPSYHEMIKNYYSRIARLQTEGGPQ